MEDQWENDLTAKLQGRSIADFDFSDSHGATAIVRLDDGRRLIFHTSRDGRLVISHREATDHSFLDEQYGDDMPYTREQVRKRAQIKAERAASTS